MPISACYLGVKVTTHRLPGAGLANFFSRRGRNIFEACGALWHSVPNRFLMSLPYQQPLDPAPGEIQGLLRSSGAVGVRFPSQKWPGMPGGVYVYRGRDYSLKSVHIKHRPRVRKGLQVFEVRAVGEDDLLNQGLQLNHETMARQGHYDPEFGEAGHWARLVRAMRECPEIGAIGAFDGQRLSAYMITCREDRWLNVLHQMSRQDDLKSFPNHALTYWVTKTASEDASLEGVSYGLVPLIAIEGLHEYKLRFGYQVFPCTCVVVLHPRLDLMLNNRLVQRGVQLLRNLRPADQRLEMTDTILRGAAATSEGQIKENSGC
jgi:hypothetical protein